MKETWNSRIPIECSTPKMRSQIGKEIEKEMRRNSISLASRLKRKNTPKESERATKRRYDSSIELHIKPYEWEINCMTREGSDNDDNEEKDNDELREHKDDVTTTMMSLEGDNVPPSQRAAQEE